MNKLIRSILFLTTVSIFGSAGPAFAQIDCAMCDPYSNHCSDDCYICHRPGQDPGDCGSYTYTTCGDDRAMGGNCLQDNCNPSWVVTAQENRGTYGEALFSFYYPHLYYSCAHHRVDAITETDANACNMNTYWQTRSSCIDYVDAWKPSSLTYQDCCDGFDASHHIDPTYSCNDYHSCS
jgi:hypothetical protein